MLQSFDDSTNLLDVLTHVVSTFDARRVIFSADVRAASAGVRGDTRSWVSALRGIAHDAIVSSPDDAAIRVELFAEGGDIHLDLYKEGDPTQSSAFGTFVQGKPLRSLRAVVANAGGTVLTEVTGKDGRCSLHTRIPVAQHAAGAAQAA